MRLILGIETSCDETGIAIYDSNRGIVADVLYSQIELHNQYGGVVPELASRDHIKHITKLINSCVTQAQISLKDLDAIAYTAGPGLNGALLTGAGVANGLAFSLNKPVVAVHHLEGHLLSSFLSKDKPSLPFIALLVSGGHSQLILVEKIGKYKILGDTLDDAAGEAFDKTAKMLGLPYPGGSHIASLALNGTDAYQFPRPMLHSKDLQMSFSGLKTAVRTLINKLDNIDDQTRANIAKSIEEAITDVLVKKSLLAIATTKVNNLVVCGGVSANLTLRKKLANIDAKIYYPPLKYCTDNGAMIAITGANHYKRASYNYSFSTFARWDLEKLYD